MQIGRLITLKKDSFSISRFSRDYEFSRIWFQSKTPRKRNWSESRRCCRFRSPPSFPHAAAPRVSAAALPAYRQCSLSGANCGCYYGQKRHPCLNFQSRPKPSDNQLVRPGSQTRITWEANRRRRRRRRRKWFGRFWKCLVLAVLLWARSRFSSAFKSPLTFNVLYFSTQWRAVVSHSVTACVAIQFKKKISSSFLVILIFVQDGINNSVAD